MGIQLRIYQLKPRPDVQVTKDHVPVVYHDFLVSETGTDAAMHTISYPQVLKNLDYFNQSS